jgi:hypothetical protein
MGQSTGLVAGNILRIISKKNDNGGNRRPLWKNILIQVRRMHQLTFFVAGNYGKKSADGE